MANRFAGGRGMAMVFSLLGPLLITLIGALPLSGALSETSGSL